MTIQERLRELGTLRLKYAGMLKEMWKDRSVNCRSKKKPLFDHWDGDPMCKEIKDLDHADHVYRCCYNNCPYT